MHTERRETIPPEESGVGAEDGAAETPQTQYFIDRLRLQTVLFVLLSHVLDSSRVKSCFFTILSLMGNNISIL